MIYNEDCLEGMKKLADNSVDMILTDLPYNIMEYDRNKRPLDLKCLWQQFNRILKPARAAVMFASSRFTMKLAASNLDNFKYKWCWVKNTSCNFVQAKNRPMSKYEDILVFSDGVVTHKTKSPNRMIYNPQGLKGCSIVSKNTASICFSTPNMRAIGTSYTQTATGYPVDVLYFDAPPTNRRAHPNEKPTALLEYLIRTYSNEGETVLDATMGSGSTGVACVNTGRNFIGFELDEGYFKVAERRIAEAQNNYSA